MMRDGSSSGGSVMAIMRGLRCMRNFTPLPSVVASQVIKAGFI
jgi:hypothetical protein